MAEELEIPPSNTTVKVRNPLGVVALALVTIGVYFFFWWYFINREMRDFGRARGADLGERPGNSVLAVTLGALIVVPAIVTLWTTSERVSKAQAAAGLADRSSGPVTFLLLFLVGPVGVWYVQRELDKAWRTAVPELPAQGTAPAGPAGGGQPGPAT